MMQATDVLRQEHRVIEVVLTGLEHVADMAARGQAVDGTKADRALEILRNFADRCHHAKEEQQLFKVMEQRGMSHDSGPIAVMLHEHDLGRSHIRAMVEAVPGACTGDAGAIKAFGQHARGYIGLLRQHINKEDNVLYPMAERLLTDADDRHLVEAFEVIEREEMGEGAHRRYHEWAHQLADDA
jgi:hemerythrin-like domain-containing protein